MNFVGNVFFLGNMRRFRKLLSNSSSTSIPEKEVESAIEKGLWLKVPTHSNKLNDLNQKGILDSSKYKMLFNNNNNGMHGITICSYHVR